MSSLPLPVLGPLNLRGWCTPGWVCPGCNEYQSNDHEACRACGTTNRFNDTVGRLDWVIVGGESGPGARACAEEWIGRVVGQCQAAAVPVFVKQLGAFVVSEDRTMPGTPADPRYRAPNGEVWAWRAGLKDKKGGDQSEWPEDLRVREFPEGRA